MKEALLRAFDRVGGEAFLLQLAKSDPKTFVMLLSKLIPREVQAQIEGPSDLPERILAARERYRQHEEERQREDLQRLARHLEERDRERTLPAVSPEAIESVVIE